MLCHYSKVALLGRRFLQQALPTTRRHFFLRSTPGPRVLYRASSQYNRLAILEVPDQEELPAGLEELRGSRVLLLDDCGGCAGHQLH